MVRPDLVGRLTSQAPQLGSRIQVRAFGFTQEKLQAVNIELNVKTLTLTRTLTLTLTLPLTLTLTLSLTLTDSMLGAWWAGSCHDTRLGPAGDKTPWSGASSLPDSASGAHRSGNLRTRERSQA